MALNKRLKLAVHDRVSTDLDDVVAYYNSKQPGLGKSFYLEYKKTLKNIKRNPHYRIFYDDIHCLQVGQYPYLIHYSIDENDRIIFIEAVICTYKNPDSAYLK